MKKIIIVLLTISLLIFMLSCNNDNNFSVVKKVKAEEIEEMALSDFNIYCCPKTTWATYSNSSIQIVEDPNEIEGMDIGLTNATYNATPTGNWDFPFLQLKDNTLFVLGDAYINSSYIFVFTFHFSKTSNDWGYYTYIVCYVSKGTKTMTLNSLFHGYESVLTSGSYDSGNFYSLTGVDIYSESTNSSQWSFFPVFNYRNMSGSSLNKKMYLNPSYLLYDEIDDTLRYKTNVATLLCFNMYYSQDYPNLDEFNISNYTLSQNLKYRIKNNVYYSYSDVRFPIYNNLYYSFVQSTYPDENIMIWDNRSTTLYMEVFNPTPQTWSKMLFSSPNNMNEEYIFKYFYNNTSQVVPTNYEIIEPDTPEGEGDGEGYSKFAEFAGVITAGIVMVMSWPVNLIVGIINSIKNQSNFFEETGRAFLKVFKAVYDFIAGITQEGINFLKDVITNPPDIFPPDTPETLQKAITAGIIAIVLLLLSFTAYMIITNKKQ